MSSSSTSTNLLPWKTEFLKAAIQGGVLKFGSFTLKSGRISPYFFNAGDFYRADLLQALSVAYARAVLEARETYKRANANTDADAAAATKSNSLGPFDVVFGPAYKGIPLATATTDKLAQLSPQEYSSVCYSFDRKEAKDHGEGGTIVGSPLKGKKVLIVDDVITAGTAKREAIAKIRAQGGEVIGIVVALDRMETLPSSSYRGGQKEQEKEENKSTSAIGEIRREYQIPVVAILTLDDIIEGIRGMEGLEEEEVRRVEKYREMYKARD